MDPENQDRIKSLVDEHGAEDLVVVLGAADLEALEVAAETVTLGDPAYVGPLAGVQLGLPVVHILEEEAGGAVRVVKVDSTQNREVCRELRVFGLPTYILMRDGEELERLSGEVTKQQVEDAFATLKGGEAA